MQAPRTARTTPLLLTLLSIYLPTATARADTLELADGAKLENCYVRDDATQILVWENLGQIGGPPARTYPRSAIRGYKVDRGDDWDEHPPLPDLTVTFIEHEPKLPGLHGRVDYDRFGRPSLRGGTAIRDLGDRAWMHPEEAALDLKLQHAPGDPIRLTAHVKNVGFATAEPFVFAWLIDGREAGRGRCTKALPEMQETTHSLDWRWADGLHTVTFRIVTDQREIATINNEATDPLWGWGFAYVVHTGRVAAWHQNRTAYGTFAFEDFYRWHLDIMNALFAQSAYPSAPDGIMARVRLDRIVYADDVAADEAAMVEPDGIRHDQGRWIWIDEQDRNGRWEPPTKEWRNQTEWSLPHELGHQLGLTDYYALDYAGHEFHVMPDNGDLVTHFMTHAITMMHWHGPHLWSELDADYLNATWNMPRGHFGDYYFAIPRETFLHVADVNGRGVPEARVEVFQRGVEVDPAGEPGRDQGVLYYPVVEDGNFDHPVSKDPVIAGTTDAHGWLRLPNRPAAEVRTLNGFHRRPNPFGNINVVGGRGLLLVKVTKEDRPCHYWLEIYQFNVAWFRGDRDRFTIELRAPYGSVDSPPPPRAVAAARLDPDRARITWEPAPVQREQHYFDRALGYRVYRRISSDGLNDRPWFPVATLGPEARTAEVDLREFPEDIYWYSKANRFAVTAIGDLGVESALAETLLP